MREDLSRVEGSSVSCFFSHVELNIKSAPTSGCVESTTKMSREKPLCLWSRTNTVDNCAGETLRFWFGNDGYKLLTRLQPRNYKVRNASSNAALKKKLLWTSHNSR